jgi:Flp pilus assembly protein CpaB
VRVGTLNRIIVAALCAAVATYLTVSYVMPSAAKRPPAAVQEVRQVATPAPGLDTRTVVVASVPLRFGMVLTADALTEVPWPSASVPPGSFSSREALLGPGGQRSVVSAIGKAEPILASKITAPGQRGTLASVIDDGKRAITIRVDDVLGVAGFVQPDDRVDVLHTRNEVPAAQPVAGVYATVLLQNVRVLAIDQIADRGTQAKPAKAVTIEVTLEEAGRVSAAQRVGQLGLVLRPVGSSSTSAVRRVDLEDDGQKGRTKVPAVHDHFDAARVVVQRGTTDRSAYEFTAGGKREVRLSGAGQQEKEAQGAERDTAQLIARPQ